MSNGYGYGTQVKRSKKNILFMKFSSCIILNGNAFLYSVVGTYINNYHPTSERRMFYFVDWIWKIQKCWTLSSKHSRCSSHQKSSNYLQETLESIDCWSSFTEGGWGEFLVPLHLPSHSAGMAQLSHHCTWLPEMLWKVNWGKTPSVQLGESRHPHGMSGVRTKQACRQAGF